MAGSWDGSARFRAIIDDPAMLSLPVAFLALTQKAGARFQHCRPERLELFTDLTRP